MTARKDGPRLPIVNGMDIPTLASTMTIEDLVAFARQPHPDAMLIAACDRMKALHDKTEQTWRKGKGAATAIRAWAAEHDEVMATIARTAACTALGRRSKAEAALLTLGDGTWVAAAKSALLDFLREEGARP